MGFCLRPYISIATNECGFQYLYSISNEIRQFASGSAFVTKNAAGLFLYGNKLVPVIIYDNKRLIEIILTMKKECKPPHTVKVRPAVITISGPPNLLMLQNVKTAVSLVKDAKFASFYSAPLKRGEITIVVENPPRVAIYGLLEPADIGHIADCCSFTMYGSGGTFVEIDTPRECKCLDDLLGEVVEEFEQRIIRQTALKPAAKERGKPAENIVHFWPGYPPFLQVQLSMLGGDEDDVGGHFVQTR